MGPDKSTGSEDQGLHPADRSTTGEVWECEQGEEASTAAKEKHKLFI